MFLQLEQVEVRYAKGASHAAVSAVSLGLRRGQIGVLIGPSGCGKTSLLRGVAGLERLHSGRIRIDGDVLGDAASGTHLEPESRRIGMVFQDYALFPHLSVAENVAFGIAHLDAAQRRTRTQEVLDLVGLGHGLPARNKVRRAVMHFAVSRANRIGSPNDCIVCNRDCNSRGTPGGTPRSGRAPGTPSADPAKLQQAASDAAKDIQNQRLAERMQQSADTMRKSANGQSGQSSGQPSSTNQPSSSQPSSSQPSGQPSSSSDGQTTNGTPTARAGAPNQAGAQQELARALDRLADRLNLVDSPQDSESRRLNDQVTRARDLRDRMDTLTRQLQELDQQASSQARGEAQPSSQAQGRASQNGQPGQGQGGSSGDPSAVDRLRADIDRQMKEVRNLLGETQKENARSEGGPGATFEGQGMVLSAPGTQGFN